MNKLKSLILCPKQSIVNRRQGLGREQFHTATAFTFLAAILAKEVHTSTTCSSTMSSKSSGMSSSVNQTPSLVDLLRSARAKYQRHALITHLYATKTDFMLMVVVMKFRFSKIFISIAYFQILGSKSHTTQIETVMW